MKNTEDSNCEVRGSEVLKLTEPRITSFDGLRRSYNRRFGEDPIEGQVEHYAWVLSLLKPTRGRMLLDVACGGGHFLKQAEAPGLVLYGCDISEVALNLARVNAPTARLALCAGEDLPFGDAKFDYIVCLGSLEHFLSPEKGVRELARVAKAVSIVCVLLPNIYPLYEILHTLRTGYGGGRDQNLERFAGVNDWRDILNANGLEVIRIYASSGFERGMKRFLMRAVTPFRLAQVFVYLCKKG